MNCNVRTVFFLLAMGTFLSIHAGQEIEIKMQLEEPVLDALLQKIIDEKATLVATEEHTEYYLNNPDKSFYFDSEKGYKDALGSLRIRMTDKGDSMCYKFRHIDPITGKTTHRDEHETKIGSGDEALKLFKAIGYTEEIFIRKARTKYQYKDFEICLDKVADIGFFVEVELKKDVIDPKEGLALIREFLKEWGITKFKQFDRSYVHMILNPGYDFGENVTL